MSDGIGIGPWSGPDHAALTGAGGAGLPSPPGGEDASPTGPAVLEAVAAAPEARRRPGLVNRLKLRLARL